MIEMVLIDFGNTGVDPAKLPLMASALTIQVQRDFALPPPFGYGITATIRAGRNSKDIQPHEWVVGLFAHADQPGALGYHDQTPGGQPLAKVFPLLDAADGGDLCVTISHEVLETLADPNVARAAQDMKGRFWAYEVADACEDTSYPINGLQVSNFVLPPYFEPIKSRRGLKLDFMGLMKQPLQILPGGYGQYFSGSSWKQVTHSDKAPRGYRRAVKGRRDRRSQ
jgi:hypothetical protein